MSVNDILRKMAVVLEKNQRSLFTYDIEKQKRYIKRLGVPKDEIERSYFQYKCQMRFNGTGITFLLNTMSFPVALFYLVKYRKNNFKESSDKKEAVFFRDGKPENILPKFLQLKYQSIEKNPEEGIFLFPKDRKFIKQLILRYPVSWQFILKCIIKIGRYSHAIEKYSPDAIIVCAEYSFTSSVLTAYCRDKGIKHINVMHGEKMYYMRDAFFEFDKCFVWDAYYKELLSSMGAEETQFLVEKPESLIFSDSVERKREYDYTYYLGNEKDEVLRCISECLMKLKEKEVIIAIRPHPRYSDMEKIKEYFSFIEIEDVKNISIEQSLMRTGFAISLYSTVLNQALCNSIPIVIDDLSNPDNYRKLNLLGYICLKKEHQLLSEIVEG